LKKKKSLIILPVFGLSVVWLSLAAFLVFVVAAFLVFDEFGCCSTVDAVVVVVVVVAWGQTSMFSEALMKNFGRYQFKQTIFMKEK